MKMSRRRKIWLLLAAIVVVAVVALPLYRYVLPDPVGELSRQRYPIRGIDVSAHNGDVDFEAVRRAGYSFVLIKASEGSDFKDSRFVDNIRRARQAGLKVGAYHFFRFDGDGYTQGLNLLHSLRGRRLDLPVVIDIEEWANPTSASDDTVAARLDRLITHIESHGHSVMLYTNKNGYKQFIRDHRRKYPLWLCSMSEIDDDVQWTIWQYSHTGRIDGVRGSVDVNVFNGDSVQWETWCRSHGSIMQ